MFEKWSRARPTMTGNLSKTVPKCFKNCPETASGCHPGPRGSPSHKKVQKGKKQACLQTATIRQSINCLPAADSVSFVADPEQSIFRQQNGGHGDTTGDDEYLPAPNDKFAGPIDGYCFQMGPKGIGYYKNRSRLFQDYCQ